MKKDAIGFFRLVEFWLITNQPDHQLLSQVREVVKSQCVCQGGCAETYINAVLAQMQEFEEWRRTERKILATSGFEHLYIAGGYR
jgi:hypothetical protein